MTERRWVMVNGEGCGTMQSVGTHTPGAGTLSKRERVAADKRAKGKSRGVAKAKAKQKRKATKATQRKQRQVAS